MSVTTITLIAAIAADSFTLTGADGQIADHGKFVVIWRNEGGTWKLFQDIWNSSVAAE